MKRRSLFARWSGVLSRNGRKSGSRESKTRLAVEALEPRLLLAADLLPPLDVSAAGASVADTSAGQPSGIDALFAPGTAADYISQIQDALDSPSGNTAGGNAPSGLAKYQTSQRWSQTATDGGGLSWGDATTITWSIAPDGTSIPGYAGESAGNSNFVSFMDGIYGSAPGGVENQPWFSLVSSVFDRWSQVSGLHFVYEPHDDGAAFSNYANSAPGAAGVRGDIRIGGHAIDGSGGTLAYNFFPDDGEMVIDTSDNYFLDTDGNSLRLRNVMAHESGHGIGLAHVDPANQTKLMEPYATTAFDGPQLDDILAAQRLYGDKFEAGGGNDSFGTATNLGDLSGRSVSVGDNAAQQYVSIDGASDVDFFHFTAKAGAVLGATLSPLGHTYLQGPEGGTVSQFNALAQNDLVLELFDANHSLIAKSDVHGLGGAEALSGVTLQAGGDYYLRVSGKQDAVQLYQMNATVSGGTTATTTAGTTGGTSAGTTSASATSGTNGSGTTSTSTTGGTIDFNNFSVDPYGNGQDFTGTATVEDGGAALHLTGNRWKKIDFNYTITSNTVLEFDFSSSAEGQIHGIGFDSNTGISSNLTFRLYGTQNWGLANFDNYTASSGTRHYVIPVGKFYTGKASMLFFTNDDDVSNPAAESVFSNVRVYESGSSPPAVAAPTAAGDRFSVSENSAAVSLNVLANDNGGGGSLSIENVSSGSAGGTITVAADQTLTYRPAPNFFGTETFTYTAGNTAGQATATVTVTVVRPQSGAVDFNNFAIGSYGGQQDFSGTAVVGDGGQSLTLTGNVWKKIDLPYTITSNTVLEFDFSSGSQGQIHGIGFDSNTGISSNLTFRLYGTQDWGLSKFSTYNPASGTMHYVIPVGHFYTGQAANLFFVNDDDVTRPTAQSVFSNVRVYEAGAAADKLAGGASTAPALDHSLAAMAAATADIPTGQSSAAPSLSAASSGAPSFSAPPFPASFTSDVASALVDVATSASSSKAAASPQTAGSGRPDISIADLLDAVEARGLDGAWISAVDRFFASFGG